MYITYIVFIIYAWLILAHLEFNNDKLQEIQYIVKKYIIEAKKFIDYYF